MKMVDLVNGIIDKQRKLHGLSSNEDYSKLFRPMFDVYTLGAKVNVLNISNELQLLSKLSVKLSDDYDTNFLHACILEAFLVGYDMGKE
ncbi:hypothetical protein EYS14_03260 [Alteromonadaceae bacterium M269]|nr:hypothetical protein EYS14_03260 [Alteromonadaceae bacterium M269]